MKGFFSGMGVVLAGLLLLFSCGKEPAHTVTSSDFAQVSPDPEVTPIDPLEPASPGKKTLWGFYFVSAGLPGQGPATLGYCAWPLVVMTPDWWTPRNAHVSGGLGVAGTDVAAEGDWLVVTLGGSDRVEICTRDGKRWGTVSVPDPRKVQIVGDYAYVLSGAEDALYKVFLKECEVVGHCGTGPCPEALVYMEKTFYVLNTAAGRPGGEASVSYVPIGAFEERRRVGLGLSQAEPFLVRLPGREALFVAAPDGTSLIFDTERGVVYKHLNAAAVAADAYGEKVCFLASDGTGGVYDPVTDAVSAFPIPASALSDIAPVAGLWICPVNGDLYVASRGDGRSDGLLLRFNAAGTELDRLTVGVLPGQLAWDWREGDIL